MRQTAEQTARTRRRILAEAVRRLREGGPRAVRVVQIMHGAGLTHGGFYTHFPSREALLGEAIEEMAAESHVLRQLKEHPGPPATALADFLAHYLSQGHCERQPGACPLPILLPEAGVLGLGARATTLHVATRLTDRLGEILAGLGCATPRAAAMRLLAQVIGVMLLARAQPERTLRDAELTRVREDLAAAYGLKSPPPVEVAP